MAIFYTGHRPVLKGRNSNDSVHTWKGTAGTYSNWSVFNTSHVLDGAPNEDHEPGSGRHPHGLAMSRWFNGEDQLAGIKNVGGGARIDGMRYRPLEYKGTDGQGVFSGTWGHDADRETAYSGWSNIKFHGIGDPPLADPGHGRRSESDAATFGAFDPHVYKGIPAGPLEDPGVAPPVGYDNAYGKNRVNEWRGVPSANAINI